MAKENCTVKHPLKTLADRLERTEALRNEEREVDKLLASLGQCQQVFEKLRVWQASQEPVFSYTVRSLPSPTTQVQQCTLTLRCHQKLHLISWFLRITPGQPFQDTQTDHQTFCREFSLPEHLTNEGSPLEFTFDIDPQVYLTICELQVVLLFRPAASLPDSPFSDIKFVLGSFNLYITDFIRPPDPTIRSLSTVTQTMNSPIYTILDLYHCLIVSSIPSLKKCALAIHLALPHYLTIQLRILSSSTMKEGEISETFFRSLLSSDVHSVDPKVMVTKTNRAIFRTPLTTEPAVLTLRNPAQSSADGHYTLQLYSYNNVLNFIIFTHLYTHMKNMPEFTVAQGAPIDFFKDAMLLMQRATDDTICRLESLDDHRNWVEWLTHIESKPLEPQGGAIGIMKDFSERIVDILSQGLTHLQQLELVSFRWPYSKGSQADNAPASGTRDSD
ncbi:hypothetical protein IWQ62_001304 [Dispira parvispora]|uniref:Uncharacterized protein n=1 Tax=Dispira parvispora TaxID=1520584 RepID=A0A9W8AYP7_9FUNG|nr:hypothetical protein IWQ62_001304 [Dispira parvispora]